MHKLRYKKHVGYLLSGYQYKITLRQTAPKLKFGALLTILELKFGALLTILELKFGALIFYNTGEDCTMFKRKVYDELKKWKIERQGKCAILLEGARRVGKSTIVEDFAKNEYKSYILIDFAKVGPSILSIFDDINQIETFFLRLQTETGIKLYDRESVIIFDEVELFPRARQAIKYLVQDGRYDYIETGSLISIKKNVQNILIPSEEHKIEVCPLDFEEFCNAIGYNYSLLKELNNAKKPIGESTNRSLMRIFNLYIAVGGMPQAVDAYINKQTFEEIDSIKQDIINLYKDDLRKIDKSGRLSKLYESIPPQLVSKRNRFSFGYSLIKKNRHDDERLYDLLDSKIVNCCYRLNEISSSLDMHIDLANFKLYVGDTGLFVSMIFNNGDNEHIDIYKKLISNKLDSNLGYLYENAVAQIIAANRNKLYYYNFPKDNSSHNYEIDFLLKLKGKIAPLEIKSSKVLSHKSLDNFGIKFSKYVGQKYIISMKDYSKKEGLINLPFYLLPLLLEEK